MKPSRPTRSALPALALVFAALVARALAGGTAFIYQGQLTDHGLPATGCYDLRFTLYDAPAAGNAVSGTLTNASNWVSNGVFAVTLDFGAGVFDGSARWLQVDVRTNGAGGFVPVLPPQPILAVPYAMTAQSATLAGSAAGFTGALAGDVSGAQGATVVASVGGQTAATVAAATLAANTATSANTAGALVRRDAYGGFSSGVIAASRFIGDGSGLTNLALAMVGGAGSNTFSLSLGQLHDQLQQWGLGLWYFAHQYGYSPTNSPAGNATALDACIADCTNRGGGVIYIGVPSGSNRIILDAGEHLLLGGTSGSTANVTLVGDGATVIQSTLTSTRRAVFYGCFDATDLIVQGPGVNYAWVYPFTNCVGLDLGPYYSPKLSNVKVSGFSQGIALEYNITAPGSRLERCLATSCTVGYAVGDDADNAHFESCGAVQCQYGLYNSIMTPWLADTFAFPQGTDLIDTAGAVTIEGGIWASNRIGIVAGNALWMRITGAGFWANQSYHIALGVPPDNWNYGNMFPAIELDNLDFYGNGAIPTNIFEYPVQEARITMRNFRYGGGGIGLVAGGYWQYIEWDNCNEYYTNLLFFAPGALGPQAYSCPNGSVCTGNGLQKFKLATAPISTSPPGTFSFSVDAGVYGSAKCGPFSAGFVGGDLSARYAQMSLVANSTVAAPYPTDFWMVLSNMSLTADGPITANAGASWGVVTNAGLVWLATNNLPAGNWPSGSICTRSDSGDLYVFKSGMWNLK